MRSSNPALRQALAAAAQRAAAVGPCNTRCAARGSCAFRLEPGESGFCRQRRPPRRADVARGREAST